jgi:hypothetical protein
MQEKARKKFKYSAKRKPAEVIQETVNNANETTLGLVSMSANDHPRETTSQEAAPTGIETTTNSPTPLEHMHLKRPVLDESGHSLGQVLEALKTHETDRIADSAIPGKCAALTNTEPLVFARLITGIAMNCVNSNATSLVSAVEIESRRL